MYIHVHFILVLFLPISILCQTFTNPIIDGNSADPCAALIGENYYLTLSTSTETEITIYKSPQLTNFRNAESRVIFRAPEGYHNVWASELHEMPDGNLYLYFAMGQIGQHNRNYVIKADDPQNPMGNWSTEAIRLLPHLELPGVDGTILRHGGKVYYVWSGRDEIEGSIRHDSILITEMISPTETKNTTAIIRQPLLPWERNVNEGPYFIYRNNVSYLLFAASFTFSEYYCLGLMSIQDHLDPMIPSNWWYGPEDGPVFYKSEEEDVYGPGHACFTTSPDKTETWMVYHGSEDRERIEHYRIARVEKIEWDDQSGLPIFPRPHGYFSPMPVPSGQIEVTKDTFTNPILSGDSPDPRVLRLNTTYYLSLSSHTGDAVILHKSSTLTNFRNTESVKITWDCFSEIWSPELRLINGQLFLYLSGKLCIAEFHTVFVSRANDSSNPFGEWSALTPLLPGVNAITADGTVVDINNKPYLVYESREQPYGLWIAEMEDPMKVKLETRKFLKGPTENWEAGVVNGPSSIKHGNRTFLSYSAGNPNGEDYCTGLMWIENGSNPMNPVEWEWKQDGPVFYKKEGVYGPGHVGYTTTTDDRETWITYHAAEYPDRIFGNRIARIDKLEWNEGFPVYPRPHGFFEPMPLPN